jgi:serine/threonine-protein kinase RsbW
MTTSLHIRFTTDPAGFGWHAKLESELAALARSAGLDEIAEMGLNFALVEAINNVIEHAYVNTAGKPIELHGHHDGDRLTLVLRDRGLPMPLPLPDGAPVDPMAESGRGWQIIRATFPHVRYERTDGENVLTLIRPLSNTDAA